MPIRRTRHGNPDPTTGRTHPLDNLYRFTLWPGSNRIATLEHFNKDPEIRAIEGRWSHCPNLNIIARIESEL